MASSTPERTFRQESSRSARASSSCPSRELRRVRRKRRDKAREGCVGARVVLCHVEQIRDAEGKAEVVDHQGAAHDATGDVGRERILQRRAEAQSAACGGLPPGVVRQVTAERGATDAHSCPSKATDAHTAW